MNSLVNISRYSGYFHDGDLYDVRQRQGGIDFYLGSVIVCPDDIESDVVLSKNGTIQGVLHLEGVQKNVNGSESFLRGLLSRFPGAEVLDFEVDNCKMKLGVLWKRFPYDPSNSDYTVTEIQAQNIWWENIPNLEDRYE